MATKRHKPVEIVTKLRQFEVLVGQGMARVEPIRQVRIAGLLSGLRKPTVETSDPVMTTRWSHA